MSIFETILLQLCSTAAQFTSILTTEMHFTCLESYVLGSIILLIIGKLTDKPEQSWSDTVYQGKLVPVAAIVGLHGELELVAV